MRLRVRVADIHRHADGIRRIREAVFVHEQRVPVEIEMDERDVRCVHVVALADGQPVGTGRIDIEKGGKIGRVAVLPDRRGLGIGTALMNRLHLVATTHGLSRVWCHAQRSAVPFYERLGYMVTSQPFQEAGIEHVEMERWLAASSGSSS
jgi:predicted GNAT family N-acyltransferase